MEKKKSGLATAGLVLGIIGVCLSFIPVVGLIPGLILGVLALIFGLVPLFQKASIGKAVAAFVLGVAAIAITLVTQASLSNALSNAADELNNTFNEMTGSSTEKILAENLDVTFGNFEVVKGDYFDQSKLIVTLKNKGQERKSFSVQIEAVDAQGARLTTDWIYANDLNAGQSQSFDTFTLVSSSDYEALKQATFKVVEVSMV